MALHTVLDVNTGMTLTVDVSLRLNGGKQPGLLASVQPSPLPVSALTFPSSVYFFPFSKPQPTFHFGTHRGKRPTATHHMAGGSRDSDRHVTHHKRSGGSGERWGGSGRQPGTLSRDPLPLGSRDRRARRCSRDRRCRPQGPLCAGAAAAGPLESVDAPSRRPRNRRIPASAASRHGGPRRPAAAAPLAAR